VRFKKCNGGVEMKNIILAMAVLAILTATSVIASPLFGAETLISTSGKDITITGKVLDAPEGANVRLFCGGRSIGEFPIINEEFIAITTYGGINGCNPGAAVLKIGDAQADIIIPEMAPVILPKGGASKDEPTEESYTFMAFGFINEETDALVPEFSLITLGTTIIAVGLGIAMMRKPN